MKTLLTCALLFVASVATAQPTTQIIAGPLTATNTLGWLHDGIHVDSFVVVTDGVAANVGMPTRAADGVYRIPVPVAGRTVGNHVFVVKAHNNLSGADVASAEHQATVVDTTMTAPTRLLIEGQIQNALASLFQAIRLLQQGQ